jgi:putative Ig domain-containing protein/centrosomal CEP192-like protein
MSHCEASLPNHIVVRHSRNIRGEVRNMSATILRRVSLAAVLLTVFGATGAGAATGITITKSELNSSQLRVEGNGALPNHSITITPGNLTGTTDANGAFKVQVTPYSSSTCQVTVSDGATSASASLAGCTPTVQTVQTAPAVALSPASLAYASRDTGTTSPAQSVTVSNSGSASLFFNSAAIGGLDALDFTVVGDLCSGVTLAPGASCTMSVTFSPTAAGTRTAALTFTDNAPNSPQKVSLTGTGTTPAGTTAPGVAIDNQFFTCTGSVCDIAAGSNVFVNNFFTTSFRAAGGTAPYTWSGNVPAGLTLRPSGLLLGAPTTIGGSTFTVTVTDAAGATASGTFSLTVTGPPAPTPSGCQTGGTVKEALSGSALGGQTPGGQATVDESKFSGCGGFSVMTAQVKNVNLPDGTVLWVTLDFKPVGTITLKGGSGTMAQYNLGDFGVSRDAVRVYSALPDVATSQQILIGGSFQ